MTLPRTRTVHPLWSVPLVALAAAIAGQILGAGGFFIVLAAGALLAAIWIFWVSLQSLTGDAPLTIEEAIGLGAPSAEEERKVAVLRALKDLEFERGVGKISEEDYQELSRKYRREAKALLMLLDDSLGPARERAAQLFEERLKELGVEPAAPADEDEADRDEADRDEADQDEADQDEADQDGADEAESVREESTTDDDLNQSTSEPDDPSVPQTDTQQGDVVGTEPAASEEPK